MFSTYFGGDGTDLVKGMATDPQGNVYVTGDTSAASAFPLLNPFQPLYYQPGDGFVAKIDPAGVLVYSSYLGGGSFAGGGDWASDIAVTPDGSAVVYGSTTSTDFPTVQPIQATKAGLTECFIARVSPAGDALTFSTYLGGADHDQPTRLASGPGDTVVLTGSTNSTDFPVVSPLQPALAGAGDAFVVRLDLSIPRIDYSTFLGGGDSDKAFDVAVDSSGNAYLTGFTHSLDFPLVAAVDSTMGGTRDAFWAVLDGGGTRILESSFLGGTGNEAGAGVGTDSSSNVYISGSTFSDDFPVHDAFQPTFRGGGSDAFVVRVNRGNAGPEPGPVGNTLKLVWTAPGASLRATWQDVPPVDGHNLNSKVSKETPFAVLVGSAPSGLPGLIFPAPPEAAVFFAVAANNCGLEGPF